MMVDDRSAYRASDAERQQVADRLKHAHDEGRLGFAEFDQRLRDAYTATAHGELDRVTADLPPVRNEQQAQGDQRTQANRHRPLVVWLGVLGTALFMTLLWGIACLVTGSLMFFWPIFPVGIGVVGATMYTISGKDKGQRGSETPDLPRLERD